MIQMNSVLRDIWSMISSMSFIDFILYFAVITLIVLVVSLIYVMYVEKMENMKASMTLKSEDNILKEETPLFEEEQTSDEQIGELDLLSVIDEINENPKPLVDMTVYEEEQEKRAIISYEELLASSQAGVVYDKEEMIDDVIPVKKLSLNTIDSPKEITYLEKEPKIEIESNVVETPISSQLFSYEKEEKFLKALQQLSELLN